MLAAVQFLWNATRGHHLRPWKSEYVRWRVETYSGIHADDVDGPAFARFMIRERYRLFHFLAWTGKLDRAKRT